MQLRYFGGLPVHEIAAMLELSPSSVEKDLQRPVPIFMESCPMSDTLSPERYVLLCDLVDRAQSFPAEDRVAFLETECAEDAILLRQARNMLAYRDEAIGRRFLTGTAPVSIKSVGGPSAQTLCGFKLGPYQIEAQIAVGGMGVVYRAQRVDDYSESVAIKVIRPGMCSDDVVQRFLAERQVLAGLRHPNIATLLDGGTMADGQPYFVMEYIEGEPITTFCDRRQLSVQQRLLLFKKTAAAVQYAHQRTVLHRDLKPNNILITPKGDVKLVDFGIAKIVRPPAMGRQPANTLPQDRALTPDYASPEQVRGDMALITSDVYSLGVVLYELLAGRPPFDLSALSWAQVETVICQQTPEAPSTAIGYRAEVGGRLAGK